MTNDLAMTIEELGRAGARRFVDWDAAVFAASVVGPAATLLAALEGQPSGPAVTEEYLRLLQEGIGTRLIRRTSPGPDSYT